MDERINPILNNLNEVLFASQWGILRDLNEAKERYLEGVLKTFPPGLTIDDLVLEEGPFKIELEVDPMPHYSEDLVPRLRATQEFRSRFKTFEEKKQEEAYIRQKEIDSIIFEI